MICEIFYGLVGLAFLYYLVLFLIGDADNATYLAKENKEYYRDKVVWITGASSGIGLQFCRHISALRVGAKLIISARTAKKLQDLAAELKAADDTKVAVVPCDLANIDSLKAVYEDALKAFGGRIDILVNNGGVSMRSESTDTSMSVENEIMTVDYVSCVALSKLVLPSMMKRKSGHIANVSSLAGIVATPLRSAYCGAKSGLMGYFNAVRLEQFAHDTDVVISNLCPGAVKTSIGLNRRLGDGSKMGYTDQSIVQGMTVERCCQLMSNAISNRIEEAWITNKLLEKVGTYTRQYTPSIHLFLIKRSSKRMIKELMSRGEEN